MRFPRAAPAPPRLVSSSAPHARSGLLALTLGAVGVVYGDIGTSPLYALKEVFAHGHVPLTPENILGVLSMIFWTLTVVVSLKYVVLILRADNNGEGGLIAMLALASQAVQHRPVLRRRLLVLGIFGTAIFFGDGVITPAISVLSAVEGLEVAAPALHRFVVPVTLVVLTVLFLVQRHGTSGIGRFFGPVTVVWFAVLALLGLTHIAHHPAVLWALSPHYALRFIADHPGIAFIALGSVVLCVTGAEALYADMGHFGKRPIRLAWFGLVMPALVINYFGQGAMLLPTEDAVKIALRTQQIIAEESGVANTVDPLGGSWFIEELTTRLENEAIAYIKRIDEMGGMVCAIEKGYPQREIAASAYRFQRQLEAGERVMVGVNKYGEAGDRDANIPLLRIDERAQNTQVANLAKVKATRDASKVKACLDGVRDAASNKMNLMPPIIEAAKAYCTQQEICDVLRDVFGTYTDPAEF